MKNKKVIVCSIVFLILWGCMWTMVITNEKSKGLKLMTEEEEHRIELNFLNHVCSYPKDHGSYLSRCNLDRLEELKDIMET